MNIVSALFSLFLSVVSIVILSDQRIVSAMIDNESSYFLGRYCVVITVSIACMYFIFKGVMFFIQSRDKRGRIHIKNEYDFEKSIFDMIDVFIVSLLALPWTVSVIETSKKFHWKVIVVVLDVVVMIRLVSSLRELKSIFSPREEKNDPRI